MSFSCGQGPFEERATSQNGRLLRTGRRILRRRRGIRPVLLQLDGPASSTIILFRRERGEMFQNGDNAIPIVGVQGITVLVVWCIVMNPPLLLFFFIHFSFVCQRSSPIPDVFVFVVEELSQHP
jgi:hypothetical protein